MNVAIYHRKPTRRPNANCRCQQCLNKGRWTLEEKLEAGWYILLFVVGAAIVQFIKMGGLFK